jgi:hypothetical protein
MPRSEESQLARKGWTGKASNLMQVAVAVHRI